MPHESDILRLTVPELRKLHARLCVLRDSHPDAAIRGRASAWCFIVAETIAAVSRP